MSATTALEPPPNRAMAMVFIMAAPMLTQLDQTIANVALPHMAGSMSASADQITWVLTSYIIATAIMTPMTGWLAGWFGYKRVFIVSIAGFTAASAFCGMAQNLEQIVLFRVLQGAFGAALLPLSQAVVFDAYPLEQRGPLMAVWGMASMVAPIAGPVLGGWLTDSFSWRWVFLINLPVGIACIIGVATFLREQGTAQKVRLDIMGFALLSIVLAAFQLFLDRGPNKDWLHSPEIQIEAAVAALAGVLFIIHTVTTDKPFLPVELLADRNFITGTIIFVGIALMMISVLALLPSMTQSLLSYPVITSGVVMAPRGLGTMISLFVAGVLARRIDPRVLIFTGLALFATSFFQMSHFSLQMDAAPIAWTGFVQGFGVGLVMNPVTLLTFATLPPALRAGGTGVFTLSGNLAGSAGISIVGALVVRNTQIAHARLTEGLTPYNPLAQSSIGSPEQMAVLNAQVTQQASMISYVGIFHVMFLVTLAAIPFVLLMRGPGGEVLSTEQPLVEGGAAPML